MTTDRNGPNENDRDETSAPPFQNGQRVALRREDGSMDYTTLGTIRVVSVGMLVRWDNYLPAYLGLDWLEIDPTTGLDTAGRRPAPTELSWRLYQLGEIAKAMRDIGVYSLSVDTGTSAGGPSSGGQATPMHVRALFDAHPANEIKREVATATSIRHEHSGREWRMAEATVGTPELRIHAAQLEWGSMREIPEATLLEAVRQLADEVAGGYAGALEYVEELAVEVGCSLDEARYAIQYHYGRDGAEAEVSRG